MAAATSPETEKPGTGAGRWARLVFWDYSLDPTAGALWYHADYVNPNWQHDLNRGPKIGRHVFYGLIGNQREKLDPGRTAASYSPD